MSNLQRAKKRYSRTKRIRAEKLSFNLFNRVIGSTTISFEESKEGIVVATLKCGKQLPDEAEINRLFKRS